MKKCPFCAEDIQDAAVVCKHCGRDLVAKKPPAWVGKEAGTPVGCPQCGTTVRVGDPRCSKCGAGLPSTDAPVGTAVVKQRGCSTVIGVGALVLVVLAIIGVWRSQTSLDFGVGVNQAPESDTSGGKSDYSKMTTAQRATVDANEQVLAKTFAGVVRSAGEPCPSVTETFYQGMDETRRVVYWNVACTNRSKFVIAIQPDAGGSTRVFDCAAMGENMRDAPCFKPLHP